MKPRDVNSELTASLLRSLLRYDPSSGLFSWRKDESAAGWIENTGYIRIKINGRTYQAHRLAWLYVKGEWPVARIDHADCNKGNNRFANLREASDSDNSKNQRLRSDNFLGVKGVRLHESGKYQARIYVDGKFKSLGLFSTAEEARLVRDRTISEIHGPFARSE